LAAFVPLSNFLRHAKPCIPGDPSQAALHLIVLDPCKQTLFSLATHNHQLRDQTALEDKKV
jgi:hypothetical protein